MDIKYERENPIEPIIPGGETVAAAEAFYQSWQDAGKKGFAAEKGGQRHFSTE